ncbi:MAG: transposase [Nitrospira sp.]|nr:transposase [Nitrospira sp.]
MPQEFITPYTPEQNGIIERFFRTLKEECVWQHSFQTIEEAGRIIRDWLHWYNEGRPHSALGYRSPVQYRAQQSTQVASGEHHRLGLKIQRAADFSAALCCTKPQVQQLNQTDNHTSYSSQTAFLLLDATVSSLQVEQENYCTLQVRFGRLIASHRLLMLTNLS